MPPSENEKTNELAREVYDLLRSAAGDHPGFRPVHARGILINGTFTPSEIAAKLSSAPHFNSASIAVTARFSSATGMPQIPDTNPDSYPHGLVLRFNLGHRKHTDIISQANPYFPVSKPEDFLEFIKAMGGGKAAEFIDSHPAAERFVKFDKPVPTSIGVERYYGLHAYKLINGAGDERYFRYRFEPEDEIKYLSEEDLKKQGQNFLYDEMIERIKSKPVIFKLMAQLAAKDDVVDDVTVLWPEEREMVELGTINLDSVVNGKEQADLQRTAIYDTVPRVEGLGLSGDPLVDFRAAVYLISGKERRAAGGYHPE